MRYCETRQTTTLIWESDTPEGKTRIAAYLLYVASCYKRNLLEPVKPPHVWLADRQLARTIIPINAINSFTVAHQGYVRLRLQSGSIVIKNVPSVAGLRHAFFNPDPSDILHSIGLCFDSLAAYYGAAEPVVLHDFMMAFREVRRIRRNPPARIID